MPFDKFNEAASAETELAPLAATQPPGTVLKYFHGPTRRFPVDYVVVEADAPDLPMSVDVLKAKGFIA